VADVAAATVAACDRTDPHEPPDPPEPDGAEGAVPAGDTLPRFRRARLLSLGFSRWGAVARRTLVEAAHDRVTTGAASLAFHGFLALFPAIVALLGVSGLVGLSSSQLQSLVHGIAVLLPAQLSSLLDQSLRRPASNGFSVLELVAGVAVALWSAAEAMANLQVTLDVAYEVQNDRGFLRRRLMSLPLIGFTVLFGGVSSFLLVLGDPLRSLFGLRLSGISAPAWDIIRWSGAIVLMMLLLSVYYYLAPNRGPARFEWISPGSVVATVGWIVASLAFSFYLAHFGHESQSYGAFAGVAVLLLWMFITATAVLLGAELNRELERAAARQPTEEAAGVSDR